MVKDSHIKTKLDSINNSITGIIESLESQIEGLKKENNDLKKLDSQIKVLIKENTELKKLEKQIEALKKENVELKKKLK